MVCSPLLRMCDTFYDVHQVERIDGVADDTSIWEQCDHVNGPDTLILSSSGVCEITARIDKIDGGSMVGALNSLGV